MAYKVIDTDGTPKKSNGEHFFGALLDSWEIDSKSFGTDEKGLRSFQAVASTSSLDRDGDIILQEGFQWAKRSNGEPAVSGQFGHNYNTVPVYRVTNLRIERGALRFTPVFPIEGESEFADEVYAAYEDSRMYGFSVGFRPIKYSFMTVGKLREMGLLDLVGEMADDVPDDTWLDGIIFEKQELMEISAVPVPANPEAQALLSFGNTKFVKSASGLMVPEGMFTQAAKEDKDTKFYYHIPESIGKQPTEPEIDPNKSNEPEQTDIEPKNPQTDDQTKEDKILEQLASLAETVSKIYDHIFAKKEVDEDGLDPAKKANASLTEKIRAALQNINKSDKKDNEPAQTPSPSDFLKAFVEAVDDLKKEKNQPENSLQTAVVDAIKDLKKSNDDFLKNKLN